MKPTQNTSTALALPDAEKITKLDALAKSYSQGLSLSDSPFSSALTTAVAMEQLRELMTPDIMAPIMKLMNSPLGFLTDRTGRPNSRGDVKPLYAVEQVRDCAIEAILRGFSLCGNEWNIIADRWYGAKAGFERKVKTFPGVTDYSDGFSAPRAVGDKGSCVVTCWAKWKKDGAEVRVDREFVCKGDQYATADAYLGKAARKLSAVVYGRLSGRYTPEGEVGDDDLAKAKPADAKTVTKPNFSIEPAPENHVVKGDSSGESKAAGSQETPAPKVAAPSTDAASDAGAGENFKGVDKSDADWLAGKGGE